MADYPTIPHLAFPLRFVNGQAVVNEQDSLADVTDCVRAILTYPQGSRIELPGFGIPDQTFSKGMPDTDVILESVRQWEPRAEVAAEANDSQMSQLVANILIAVQQEGGGV